jgi:UDP-N-acetylmuramyl pentapeptide synthase
MKANSRLLVLLAKRVYEKVQKIYRRAHGRRMPVILVAGTVGKSSQTLLINNLFEREGWTVFTGTTKEKNLNSPTGLIMVLAGFRIDFEGGRAIWKKLNFVLKSLWFWLFESYKLPEKSVLVHEVGYDHQGESSIFRTIFNKGLDVLIVTSATWEHAQGFSSQFNQPVFNKIFPSLPKQWLEHLNNEEYPALLRNTALEQLTLLPLAKSFIIPLSLGQLDNWVLDNLNGSFRSHLVTSERGQDFSLIADGVFTFTSEYLLPESFAKNAYVLGLLADKMKLSQTSVQDTVSSLELPYSRFSLFQGQLGTTLVDSSYNSDPQSLSGFLDLAVQIIQNAKTMEEIEGGNGRGAMAPKHYFVLGEMRELGNLAGQAHEQALDQIIELGQSFGGWVEGVFLIGQEWLACNDDGIIKSHEEVSFITYKKQHFKVYHKVGDLIKLFNPETIRPGSWFWIKGSQNTIFLEALVAHLLAKPEDQQKLCRQGEIWDELRQPYL